MTVAAVLGADGLVHGARALLVRSITRVARTANAATLGWRGGRLPLGSRIVNARSVSVGEGFDAAAPVWIEAVGEYAGVAHRPEIRIGERFTTSGRLHVSAIGAIDIGDDCLFGSNVYIGDHSHGAYAGDRQSGPRVPPRARPLRFTGPVRIGDRVWLGDNVVVLGGVTIGDGAVVGANSVVTRDVAAETIVAGSPAVLRKRFEAQSGTWTRAEASVVRA